MSTTLRTGADVPSEVIVPTMVNLRWLLENNTVALYELVMLCRDPAHELWGDTGEVLQGLALVGSTGAVHRITREVVLAATDGDGLNLRLRSPIELPAVGGAQ